MRPLTGLDVSDFPRAKKRIQTVLVSPVKPLSFFNFYEVYTQRERNELTHYLSRTERVGLLIRNREFFREIIHDHADRKDIP